MLVKQAPHAMTCALGIFHPVLCPASGPQQRCFVLGRCLSCGAVARMVFIMETGLRRPENAIFPPLRGRVTASAVYHPYIYGQKAEFLLSADTGSKKNRIMVRGCAGFPRYSF